MSSPKKRRLDALTTTDPAHRDPFRLTSEATRMELDALRAELEHERSLRALEARRSQQTRVRLEQHLELAVKETKELKAVLEETERENEQHIQQLRDARNDALRQLRQVQRASLEKDSVALKSQVEMAREKQRLLESQLSAVTEEAESLRKQLVLEQERSREREEQADENESPQKYLEPSGSLAPTGLMKELNRTRLLLAESERKHRQLVRKSDEWQQRSKQYMQLQEKARISSARVVQLETQIRNETKELEALRAENKSWGEFSTSLKRVLRLSEEASSTDVVGKFGPPPETARIIRLFEQLRTENQQLQQEKESVEKQLFTSQRRVTSLNRDLKNANAQQQKTKEQLEEIEARLQKSQFEAQTLQAQEGIYKREADSLRSIMQTYNDDAVMKKRDSGGPPVAAKGLELSLSSAQDEIKILKEERSRLTAQLESLQTQQDELRTQHDRVVDKFGRIKAALNEQKQKAEEAEARACKAEVLVGKGHFSPDETRVLHLKKNPLTEAMQKRYEQEISVLTKRLQEATGEKSSRQKASSTTPEVDPQKLHQRLKESFKEQIGLFREGVYLMTGYKVDMLPKTDRTTFRVRSVYAEQEHDHLLFVWPKSSDEEAPTSLDLAETEQAKILATTPSYDYMTRYNSLPAFLASVQLNLFEKQTLVSS